MGTFLKKYFLLISVLFLILLVLCAWKLPSAAPVIGIVFLCFTLGMAISAIVGKHQAAYREGRLTRVEFTRNVSLDVFGILLAMALAALLAQYVANRIAEQVDGTLLRFVAGMLVGLLVGIGVGLIVRQLWRRFVKTSPTAR